MTLRKGITHAYVARLFKEGYGMGDLAYLFDCFVRDIEQIIREVMKREEERGKR